MSDLKELNIRRGTIKGKLTRYVNYIKELKGLERILDVHVKEISRRYNDVKGLLGENDKIHNQIVNMRVGEGAEEDRGKDEEQLAAFETLYYAVTADSDIIIESNCKPTSTVPLLTNLAPQIKPKVSLPEIDLPKFNGTFDNWKEFIDTFNALVHSNETMSNVEKLHYLKSCMKEDASNIINVLAATDENYEIALNMLRKRFEHKRLIVNKHISNMYNVEKIVKGTAKEYRTLVDTINSSLLCLKSLDVKTKDWDPLLIFILAEKIDFKSRQDWESRCDRNVPKLKDFLDFIEKRCEILETLSDSKKVASVAPVNQRYKNSGKQYSHLVADANCPCCRSIHSLQTCSKFAKMTIATRYVLLKRKGLCFTCFEIREGTHVCAGKKCTKCGRPHHTMMHYERQEKVSEKKVENVEEESDAIGTGIVKTHHAIASNELILLSTAMIKVRSANNDIQECRVLLDNGSQPNLISQNMVNRLGISTDQIDTRISGVNKTESSCRKKTAVKIMNTNETYEREIACYVIDKITGNLPPASFCNKEVKPPLGIVLADPTYNISKPIDMLLGSEVFYDILCGGQVRLGKGLPTLQKTRLGWILGGVYACNQPKKKVLVNHCRFHEDLDLNCQVSKFWETETIEKQNTPLSSDEAQCEEIFKATTERNSEGRFIVKVPWKENLESLGNSLYAAKRRFYSLERKLETNPTLQSSYIAFMKEYAELGHMKLVEAEEESETSKAYYIPHHAVINESSLTTKLRVVFDASCKTDSDLSLNDVQLVGPTIQSDLFSLLLRFRKHNIIIAGDVQKMYRQINIHEADRKYHRIFWREHISHPMKIFELQTVTYGTASAPFLAVRCLMKIAEENEKSFPREASIIKTDFYVDDLLTGAETLEDARAIKENITQMLKLACFKLHKWSSNDPRLCPEAVETERTVRIGDQTKKTLGTHWQIHTDSLHYKWDMQPTSTPITKRKMLATTAKIFDPLGLLGPIIVIAKICLQSSWEQTLGWDDPLPSHMQTKWLEFEYQLQHLSSITVPRQVLIKNATRTQIHGSCDASLKAYGACIYIRSKAQGQWISRLLCAKSKVAPLKMMTLPRLELQGAVLLSKLFAKVRNEMEVTINERYLWCDSTIVLAWIRSTPNRWKMYVANRVACIQELTVDAIWSYVSSNDNPADIISRGASVEELKTNEKWWNGPPWLNKEEFAITTGESMPEELPEEKRVIIATTVEQIDALDLLSQYSSASKVIRVVAYCRRFIAVRLKKATEPTNGPLTTHELSEALNCIIRKVQGVEFKVDIMALKNKGAVAKNSKLKALAPIVDKEGLLRVGGRLNNNYYSFSKQHPILLPRSHKLSFLLMHREHIRYMHCGPQALLALVREKFWPIGGRCIAKKIVSTCVKCFRHNPKALAPIMGHLPTSRSTPASAFQISGVDYAGPILLKDKQTRGCKLTKAYICIFICFVTKAIHLEIVSELTSQCFLAALRRFASRRGKPAVLHSDNATNFTGARNDLLKFVSNKTVAEGISENLAMEDIQWKFIPPKSPHFGGLWEAAVKSVKSLLNRVLGHTHLVYEDMYTVLTQIEAILNSRPLSPMSNDPNDLTPLTPGHFLIGRPVTAVPDEEIEELPMSRLSRYQRLQQIQQHFWRRWSREYICELQQRQKWTEPSLLTEGALVLIKEDNLPPLKWQLGRVLEVRPGKDGVVRVAHIRTSKGDYIRTVHKLCVLP